MFCCLTPPCLANRLDGEYGKKRYPNFLACLAYHAFFIKNHLGALLRAYCASRVKATNIEAIMLAVNEVNRCPYCQGLHGEMYRLGEGGAGSGGSGGAGGKKSAVQEQEETKKPDGAGGTKSPVTNGVAPTTTIGGNPIDSTPSSFPASFGFVSPTQRGLSENQTFGESPLHLAKDPDSIDEGTNGTPASRNRPIPAPRKNCR